MIKELHLLKRQKLNFMKILLTFIISFFCIAIFAQSNKVEKVKLKDGTEIIINLLNNTWDYAIDQTAKTNDSFTEKQIKQESGQKIFINRVMITEINSSNGISFKIEWKYIDTSKTIKYIYFSVIPYNAVGDIQSCEISGSSSFTGQVTGPISAEDYPIVSRWENAWYNNTIKCIKITKIKVIYTDGSSYSYINELPKIFDSEFTNRCN